MNRYVAAALLVASVIAGPPASAQDEAAPRSASPVIDLHLHTGPGSAASRYYTVREGETPDEARLRSTLADMDAHGVVLAIAGGPPADAERYRREAPDRVVGAVAFPCTDGLDPNLQPCFEHGGDWPDLAWLRAEAEAGRVGALGELYNVYAGAPVDGPEMAPYLALAAELDLVVLAHADSGPPPEGRAPGCCPHFDGALGDPAHWAPVLERHPDLRLVLYHAVRPDYVETAIALMDTYPNVVVETSPMTLVPTPLVHAALRRYVEAGHADRVVFGSDAIGSIGGSLEVLDAAGSLSEEQKRAVRYDNAARFLGLGDAGGFSSDALSQIADSVAAWVEAGEVVGAEVLIAKDGRVAFHEAFGWADREARRPLRAGALFNVASMAKPVVGTAVLMLVEEGAISLDDPVARHLPAFDTEASRGITVRHLLTHTAGFDWWGPFARRAEVAEQPGLRAAVDSAGATGPQLPVGERYSYSNMSTMVLSALVAEVSGMPVEEFLKERIFEPLGMTDTHPTFSPDAPWADRVLPVYCWDGEAGRFEVCWDPAQGSRVPFFRGSGGLRTTAADYLRFMALWMNEGRLGDVRLLSEATVEEALRTHAGRLYGYHWQVPEAPVTDGLPSVFGHGGADGTAAVAFPADGTVALYFTQSGEGAPNPTPKPFFDLFGNLALLDHVGPYQLDAVRPEGLDALQLPPEALAPYVGTYWTEGEGGGTLRVTEEKGHLVAAFESEEGAWSEALVHVGDGTFAEGTFRNGRVVEYRPPLRYVFEQDGATIEGVELQFEGEVVLSFQRTE